MRGEINSNKIKYKIVNHTKGANFISKIMMMHSVTLVKQLSEIPMFEMLVLSFKVSGFYSIEGKKYI